MNKQYITAEGLEKIKKELKVLKEEKRPEVAERIRKALEQGDLSENAEYAEAKEEHAFIQGKIQELEQRIKKSEVIKKTTKPSSKVSLGSKIIVSLNNKDQEYTIVGSSEADPSSGKISNESPIGQALLDHKVGDRVNIKTPGGTMGYTIKKIIS